MRTLPLPFFLENGNRLSYTFFGGIFVTSFQESEDWPSVRSSQVSVTDELGQARALGRTYLP
jgi:hypothetical protein